MWKSEWPVSAMFIMLLILTSRCEVQEEFTLPVNFELRFRIAESPVMEGKLNVRSIALNLNSIEIEGRRSVGEDVFMTRQFDDAKFIVIRPDIATETLSFNFPQGIYDRLSFKLKFQPDNQEEDLDDDFTEWIDDMEEGEAEIDVLREDLGDIIENYLEDFSPCLIMHAEYFRNNELFNVVFVINDPLVLDVLAINANGEREVILDRSITNYGEIVFDPSILFSVVEPPVLESSFYGVIDEDNYIFLHKKVNPLLFTTIYNGLDDSAALFINE